MGKPGRPCICCSHPERARIDLMLASGIGRDTIAAQFGINEHAVMRHGKAHLSPAARLALVANTRPGDPLDLDKLRQEEGSTLLVGLRDQRARLRGIGDTAAQGGDFKSAVAAERAITNIFELIGKLCGELINRSEVRNVSLLVSPDYHRLRTVLLETLRAHPAAMRDVAAALARMENEALSEPAPAPRSAPLIEAQALPATSPPPLPPLPIPPGMPKC